MVGAADGPARAAARFDSPRAIALGPGAPYTLLVADGNAVRLVSRSAQPQPWAAASALVEVAAMLLGNGSNTAGGSAHAISATAADIAALDVVTTLAGSRTAGSDDGTGEVARFDAPSSIAFDPRDGRVYVAEAARCRLRRITVAVSAAQPLTCGARLVDILRPPACGSGGEAAAHIVGAMSLPPPAARGDASAACVGVPPPLRGWRLAGQPAAGSGGTLVEPFEADEDVQAGTALTVAEQNDARIT